MPTEIERRIAAGDEEPIRFTDGLGCLEFKRGKHCDDGTLEVDYSFKGKQSDLEAFLRLIRDGKAAQERVAKLEKGIREFESKLLKELNDTPPSRYHEAMNLALNWLGDITALLQEEGMKE